METYFPNSIVERKVKIFFFLQRNLKAKEEFQSENKMIIHQERFISCYSVLKTEQSACGQLNRYEYVTFLYFFLCMCSETHLNNFDLGMIAVG